MKQLKEFLDNSQINSKWIDENGYNTYYRKSSRNNIPDSNRLVESVLDIANINAHEESIGAGHFAMHLAKVILITQSSFNITAIYVENVLNQRFKAYLIREHGFKIIPQAINDTTAWWYDTGLIDCLYKRI